MLPASSVPRNAFAAPRLCARYTMFGIQSLKSASPDEQSRATHQLQSSTTARDTQLSQKFRAILFFAWAFKSGLRHLCGFTRFSGRISPDFPGGVCLTLEDTLPEGNDTAWRGFVRSTHYLVSPDTRPGTTNRNQPLLSFVRS